MNAICNFLSEMLIGQGTTDVFCLFSQLQNQDILFLIRQCVQTLLPPPKKLGSYNVIL